MSRSRQLGPALVVAVLAAGVMFGIRTRAQGGGGRGGQPVPEAFNPYAPAPYRLVPNWPPADPAIKWGGVIQAEPELEGVVEGLSRLNTPESIAMKNLVEEVE